MSKGRAAGRATRARREEAAAPKNPGWRCHLGEGFCAEEPTHGDICTDTTRTRWHTPQDMHALRNAPTGT